MRRVYVKMMVSFEASEDEIIDDPTGVIERALINGVEMDGEVYFPTIDSNESIYSIYEGDDEINVDGAFDGKIIKFIKS